jgi:protein-S-isoprenylcysteine O-methyltransferase Ste14
MARTGFKRWWTRLVPRAAERSTYVLASSLVLLFLFWQWRPIPALVWDVAWVPGRWALWGLYGLGWTVAVGSTFLISHADLFGLRQTRAFGRGERPPRPRLQTPGLYRYVRHPLMTGLLVAFWATPRMTAGHLLFAAGMTAYVLVGLRFEERDLVRAFGDRYRTYRERVPMLLPRLKRPAEEAPA